MNIQIYAAKRDFDVQKAERYFKERRIPYAFVDMGRHPLGARELKLFVARIGLQDLIRPSEDWEAHYIRQLTDQDAVVQELLDKQKLLRTPLVRNGQQVTVGYCPEAWAEWK